MRIDGPHRCHRCIVSVVGRWTARFLRAHSDAPLLIGGPDFAKAQRAAAKIGGAEGVVLDLAAGDLGLGERPVSAVAVFFTDERVAGLRFANARRAAHQHFSRHQRDRPEVAAYIHHPHAALVVLGTEWLLGATTVPTLELAKAFGRVHDITIGALLDEQDAFGPAATADLQRQTKTMPAARLVATAPTFGALATMPRPGSAPLTALRWRLLRSRPMTWSA